MNSGLWRRSQQKDHEDECDIAAFKWYPNFLLLVLENLVIPPLLLGN